MTMFIIVIYIYSYYFFLFSPPPAIGNTFNFLFKAEGAGVIWTIMTTTTTTTKMMMKVKDTASVCWLSSTISSSRR